jgi:asparagine synthase (glutamine-hydrolysing)
MCGIIGFVSKTDNYELIHKLTQSISHRGPDQISVKVYPFGKKYLHLGSARLAVTGLIDGDMPMHDSYGNALIYNGEIYDLKRLRKEFNIDLNSTSDTRHLLNILSNNQSSLLQEINGMFSFAYFNKVEEKLTISRDKLGIKPLFYGTNKNYDFYFSSEIKPLIDNRIVDRVTNESQIRDYLYLGGLTKKNSLISDIYTIEPGTITEYDVKGRVQSQSFKVTTETSDYKKGDQKDFKKIFCEVLDNQLEAEVPVNLLLSGGVDSTLIALFAKRYLNKNVTAFTLGYESSLYDERIASQKIVDELSINNKQFQFPANQNSEIIDDVINRLPEPISDPSIIPTYYLSKQVSNYTKVVISGDGGDEIFGGYQWYRGALLSKKIPRFSYKLFKPLGKIIDNFNDNYIPYSEMLNLLSLGKNLSLESKILLWQNYIPSEKLNNQINSYQDYLKAINFKELDTLENLKKLDIESYLYTNILKKSDTASMLNALEVRPVFLDDRIIDFSKNLKFSDNVNNFDSKLFLKKLLKKELPNVKTHKKKGFAHDFGTWTDEVGLEYLKKNWLENEYVSNLVLHLEEKNEPNYFKSRYVWKYYSIFKWLDLNKVEIN